MKILLFCFLVLSTQKSVSQYSLEWFQVGANSATSRGGEFEVQTEFGQSFVSTSEGGGFFLFPLSILFLQEETVAPTLRYRIEAQNRVILTWETSGTYRLESSSSLVPESWSSVSIAPVFNGSQWQTTIDIGTGRLFYRLTRVGE